MASGLSTRDFALKRFGMTHRLLKNWEEIAAKYCKVKDDDVVDLRDFSIRKNRGTLERANVKEFGYSNLPYNRKTMPDEELKEEFHQCYVDDFPYNLGDEDVGDSHHEDHFDKSVAGYSTMSCRTVADAMEEKVEMLNLASNVDSIETSDAETLTSGESDQDSDSQFDDRPHNKAKFTDGKSESSHRTSKNRGRPVSRRRSSGEFTIKQGDTLDSLSSGEDTFVSLCLSPRRKSSRKHSLSKIVMWSSGHKKCSLGSKLSSSNRRKCRNSGSKSATFRESRIKDKHHRETNEQRKLPTVELASVNSSGITFEHTRSTFELTGSNSDMTRDSGYSRNCSSQTFSVSTETTEPVDDQEDSVIQLTSSDDDSFADVSSQVFQKPNKPRRASYSPDSGIKQRAKPASKPTHVGSSTRNSQQRNQPNLRSGVEKQQRNARRITPTLIASSRGLESEPGAPSQLWENTNSTHNSRKMSEAASHIVMGSSSDISHRNVLDIKPITDSSPEPIVISEEEGYDREITNQPYRQQPYSHGLAEYEAAYVYDEPTAPYYNAELQQWDDHHYPTGDVLCQQPQSFNQPRPIHVRGIDMVCQFDDTDCRTKAENSGNIYHLSYQKPRLNSLTKQDKPFAQRNQDLARQDQHLTQRSHDLARQDQHLIQRNHDLARQDQHLIQRNHDLARQDQHLIQRNQNLVRHDQHLPQRNQDLVIQNQNLSQRNRDIARQDRHLSQRNHELARQDHHFSQRNQVRARQDQHQPLRSQDLNQQDQQFPQRWQNFPKKDQLEREYALSTQEPFQQDLNSFRRSENLPKLVQGSAKQDQSLITTNKCPSHKGKNVYVENQLMSPRQSSQQDQYQSARQGARETTQDQDIGLRQIPSEDLVPSQRTQDQVFSPRGILRQISQPELSYQTKVASEDELFHGVRQAPQRDRCVMPRRPLEQNQYVSYQPRYLEPGEDFQLVQFYELRQELQQDQPLGQAGQGRTTLQDPFLSPRQKRCMSGSHNQGKRKRLEEPMEVSEPQHTVRTNRNLQRDTVGMCGNLQVFRQGALRTNRSHVVGENVKDHKQHQDSEQDTLRPFGAQVPKPHNGQRNSCGNINCGSIKVLRRTKPQASAARTEDGFLSPESRYIPVGPVYEVPKVPVSPRYAKVASSQLQKDEYNITSPKYRRQNSHRSVNHSLGKSEPQNQSEPVEDLEQQRRLTVQRRVTEPEAPLVAPAHHIVEITPEVITVQAASMAPLQNSNRKWRSSVVQSPRGPLHIAAQGTDDGMSPIIPCMEPMRQQEEAVVVKSEEGLTKGGPCTPTSRHGARNRLTSQSPLGIRKSGSPGMVAKRTASPRTPGQRLQLLSQCGTPTTQLQRLTLSDQCESKSQGVFTLPEGISPRGAHGSPLQSRNARPSQSLQAREIQSPLNPLPPPSLDQMSTPDRSLKGQRSSARSLDFRRISTPVKVLSNLPTFDVSSIYKAGSPQQDPYVPGHVTRSQGRPLPCTRVPTDEFICTQKGAGDLLEPTQQPELQTRTSKVINWLENLEDTYQVTPEVSTSTGTNITGLETAKKANHKDFDDDNLSESSDEYLVLDM